MADTRNLTKTKTTTRKPLAPRCPACHERCLWDDTDGEPELVCPNCTLFATNDIEDDN